MLDELTARRGEATRPTLSVIVPTRNESGNVAPLVARLDSALAGVHAEIVFVDDSNDDTPQQIAAVGEAAAHPVRLLHREPGERGGGLGSAVLAGLRSSGATWAVVLDGDLQHPPELVPRLVDLGEATDADVVVASRYVGEGSAFGLASVARSWVSTTTTRLAKGAFPRRLGGCSDPMSGFFAVRLAGLDLGRLRPNGFKILLEILARSPRLAVREHPFTFAERVSGDSKASWREGVLFARRLVGLRLATVFGRHADRAKAAAAFAAVGVSGLLVNTAALWLFVEAARLPLLLAATLATQVSTAWNFLLTDRLVFSGPKARSAWLRLTGFAVVNNALLLARLPLLSWLVHSLGVGYLPANVLTLIAMFAARFVLSDRYLFTRGEPMTSLLSRDTRGAAAKDAAGPTDGASPRRSGPVDVVVDLREGIRPPVRHVLQELPYRYDIHGIVTIGSVAPLRELAFFRSDIEGPLDIEIRRGSVGTGRARPRTRVVQYAALPAVSYEEHLGRLGSDFHVDMTDNIQAVVGPMLVRSPHVLYTNVVEALLRFVLVSRGYMLLHSACLDLDGHGVLLSALTDTGKTGTVLRLLRENPSRFLSDDMTILDANGIARCYPKPLTISQHTLRAVEVGDLSRQEWRRLRVQSRLHSKQGRGIGSRLGEMNMPIMSLNAVTQYLVPPPKYVVERLVPCAGASSVAVQSLFVIERDAYRLADIEPDGLIDELIANTDDAYGFPPFRYFAPALVVDGLGYEELRAKERMILVSAMDGVHARRLATPDYTWADHIPNLIETRRFPASEANLASLPSATSAVRGPAALA